MTRRWIARFAERKWTVVLIGFGLLVLLEVTLRLVWGFGNPLLVEKDPDVGYFFRGRQAIRRFGNYVKVNQYHQRNDEIRVLPPPGTKRILIVGDSVTFGGTLADQQETITSLLQARLNATHRGPYEVLNASAASWGIGNHLAYVKKFGAFNSAWVIYQIGSSDLCQPKSDSSGVGIDPNAPDHRPVLAITEVITRYLVPKLMSGLRRPMPPPASVLSDAENFETNIVWFSEAVEIARSSSARVMVLHTPDRDEVVPGPAGFAAFDDPYRERFFQVCSNLSVPVVDLHQQWRGSPHAGLWFRDGIHPNPAGNAEIATSLYKALAGFP